MESGVCDVVSNMGGPIPTSTAKKMTDPYIPKRLAPGSKISQPTREGIIRDTLGGMSFIDTARKWNVDTGVVSRVRNSLEAQAAGIIKFKKYCLLYIKSERLKSQKSSVRVDKVTAKLAIIKSLMDEGKTQTQIARELGCSIPGIHGLIRDHIRPAILRDQFDAEKHATDVGTYIGRKPLAQVTKDGFTHFVYAYVSDPLYRLDGTQFRSGTQFIRNDSTGEVVKSGYWMDFPEDHWGISDDDYYAKPRKERAAMEAHEQTHVRSPRENFDYHRQYKQDRICAPTSL